ncbi:hypothetical protein BTVI_59353 [Pitangus sulphuratus]|nr:hypothetical protein BTVI_59353 [Pitangus sulphuratus]
MSGNPSIPEMVEACSRIGTVEYKMLALAAVLHPNPKCYSCGQTRHMKAQCPEKAQKGKGKKKVHKGKGKNKVVGTTESCNQCGKIGHLAKQCQFKNHINGQSLQVHKTSASSLPLCSRLTGRTAGSADMDVSTPDTVTITARDVVKVPLDAYGPIGRGSSALLIGLSSSTIAGLMIHVGVIDANLHQSICNQYRANLFHGIHCLSTSNNT